ncbi:cellulase family glycosylhydrolase [Kitasatospora sp. CM 4170]|uniref:Glycoside hydrolase family 5 protein n=1 Tax=Kitasatospora aburaviensis TaxID=67265 RepID=A0ABW1FAR1_9ACTN|nr:cellulase family glycosylhydrolase [Kitasatospora sp. CM 4170]WNM44233.1 cellulase family glycosylhydrolase [Kitasatospora sp. CM 4170]
MRTVRSATRGIPALLATAALLGVAVPGPAAAAPAAATSAPVALTGAQLSASWTGPLSTRGRYVVDAHGDRFKLKSGNWAGAQGTYQGSGDIGDVNNHQAHQKSNNIPLGLDRTPIAQIMADFHALGINSVRLPFANAMIHDPAAVPDSAVAANPELTGRTPLEVFDAVVAALTADGFAVILNNHTTTYRFCCGLDGNERWNSGQSTQQWVDDWVFMAKRYRDDKRVVGADLRNEVRRDTWNDPNWGWGDDHDTYTAYEQAGNAILQADPDLLIVMEGINWQGIPAPLFSHERPNLKRVATLSHTLIDSNKLVYSVHFYGYTGPSNTGAGSGWGATDDPRYEDFTPEKLAEVVKEEGTFVTEEGKHYTAPVWVSEFGAAGRDSTDAKEKAWFRNFTDILVKSDTDFAVWPLVGWTDAAGKPQDNWAMLTYDAAGRRLGIEDGGDWRATDWNKLVTAPGRSGAVAPVDHWNIVDIDHGDWNLSRTMLAKADWSPGDHKGNCPDTERLIGLSRSYGRGLCTDVAEPRKAAGAWEKVDGEKYVRQGDWASGYNKVQCPVNSFAVGYSMNGPAMVSLLCAPSATPLPTNGRTLWFDRGNNPDTGWSVHGNWAEDDYKGMCADNEYVAGVAMTWAWAQRGRPDALLCRPLT